MSRMSDSSDDELDTKESSSHDTESDDVIGVRVADDIDENDDERDTVMTSRLASDERLAFCPALTSAARSSSARVSGPWEQRGSAPAAPPARGPVRTVVGLSSNASAFSIAALVGCGQGPAACMVSSPSVVCGSVRDEEKMRLSGVDSDDELEIKEEEVEDEDKDHGDVTWERNNCKSSSRQMSFKSKDIFY